nr:integrase DNA-binding domain-containing protein [Ruminococcus sp. 1001713B170207_170306_F5]
MARKDNKGRNLKTGESQRPDGRYMYRYKDELTGKRVTIMTWIWQVCVSRKRKSIKILTISLLRTHL